MIELLPKTSNKSGWPWSVESKKVIYSKKQIQSLPIITVVTPSYNQGNYLEETIRSVLLQNYPKLEYIIIDGGSTDNSIEIIKKYEKYLCWWVSEPDLGQSDAINKGFSKAKGLYGNWINSDDMLVKNAINHLAKVINPNYVKRVYIGSYIEYNESTQKSIKKNSDIVSLKQLVDIPYGWRRNGGNQIGQQSAFFPLKLFRDVGMLNLNNHHTMDYELWGKLLNSGAEFIHFPETIGTFRIHEGQKTSHQKSTTKSLISTAQKLINENNQWDSKEKKHYFMELKKYKRKYNYSSFRSALGIRRRSQKISDFLRGRQKSSNKV